MGNRVHKHKDSAMTRREALRNTILEYGLTFTGSDNDNVYYGPEYEEEE